MQTTTRLVVGTLPPNAAVAQRAPRRLSGNTTALGGVTALWALKSPAARTASRRSELSCVIEMPHNDFGVHLLMSAIADENVVDSGG